LSIHTVVKCGKKAKLPLMRIETQSTNQHQSCQWPWVTLNISSKSFKVKRRRKKL